MSLTGYLGGVYYGYSLTGRSVKTGSGMHEDLTKWS